MKTLILTILLALFPLSANAATIRQSFSNQIQDLVFTPDGRLWVWLCSAFT